ncbi:MAG: alpha/beta hydrolase [Magnetovibrio sp.]|nr:alpha/beta hydrolase [Magnetovibrio sp.]MBH89197.1 alpha/beta hydrolase [Magnetovibrio sp.]
MPKLKLRFLTMTMIVVFFGVLDFQPLIAEEVKVKRGNLTLNANLNLPSEKSLSDGVVLMLHGTLAHKDMEFMRGLQDMLVERNIPNLAFNLSLAQDNRYGMFNCAGPHRHKDTNAVEEIKTWVDFLKARGATAITILGHSRGGNQVARYVADNPDRAIKRVVLISPGTWTPGELRRNYIKNYKKDLLPLLKEAKSLVRGNQGDKLMEGVDLLYCPNTIVAAKTFVDYYSESPLLDTPSVIRRIKLPVLAVVGDNDQVVPKFLEQMIMFDQPNVKFKIIEDAGHFFLDLYSEDLADEIAAFVNAG